MHSQIRMDARFALLSQAFFGEKFSREELLQILRTESDGHDLFGLLNEIPNHSLAKSPRSWRDRAEKMWQDSQDHGVRWTYPGHPDYPSLWNSLRGARPLLMSYKGEPVWKFIRTLSIVGSRAPMQHTCQWLQKELPLFFKSSPYSLVSGGARGVDQWVHRLSVDHHRPTILVFPSGILNPYPDDTPNLHQKIIDGGGALISTFALRQPMRRHLFVIRNRWIAGLSSVTFVAEANRRSGSSLTAKLAREESRTLCTLPVSPFSERGLGNLDMIADDQAHMIRHADDLMQLVKANEWLNLKPNEIL